MAVGFCVRIAVLLTCALAVGGATNQTTNATEASNKASSVISAAKKKLTVSEAETALYQQLFEDRPSVLALQPYCMDAVTELRVGQMADFRRSIREQNRSEMHVKVEIQIRQLLGVSEREQIVSMQIAFIAKWADCRLHWNFSENPVKNLFFDATALEDLNLFIPPLTIVEQIEPPFTLREASNVWLNPRQFEIRKLYIAKFACDLDLSLYPFDTQSCTITVGPVDDSLRSLNISEMYACEGECDSTKRHVSSQVLADTWDMLVLPAGWTKINYKPCTEEELQNKSIDHSAECYMASLGHRVLLRRQPTFQLLNLLFPVSIGVVLSSFVFLMPPGKGDKMGLSLTILLTLFVYTQVMYQTLPDAGRTIPLLSQYFLICIYLVTFSCLMSVVGDALDGRSIYVPAFLTKFLMRYVGPIVLPNFFKQRKIRMATIRRNAAKSGEPSESSEAANADFDCQGLEPSAIGPPEEQTQTMREDWMLLAAVFDRCFFWAHLSTTVVMLFTYVVYGYVKWTSFGGKLESSH